MPRSTIFCIDTPMHFSLVGEEAVLSLLKAEVVRLEQCFSRFLPDSEVARINAQAGKRSVRVSTSMFALMEQAQLIAQASAGAFDCTIAPLVDVLDWKHTRKPPSVRKRLKTQARVDYKNLHRDISTQSIGLIRRGMGLDLGGIAKGYAADRCASLLHDHHISSAILDLGGNVMAMGRNEGGNAWKVGIRHPLHFDQLLGYVEAEDAAVVTSSGSERWFLDRRGRKWHHILDPRTGCPAESDLLSITVIGPSSCICDGLATALFVMGIEAENLLLRQFPGYQIVALDTSQKITISKALEPAFHGVKTLSSTTCI